MLQVCHPVISENVIGNSGVSADLHMDAEATLKDIKKRLTGFLVGFSVC